MRPKEPDKFESEVLVHLDALYRSAFYLTKNKADAEDLTQDTLIKAMRGRQRFAPNTNLRAWLFTILRNTFLNGQDRERRARQVLGDRGADFLANAWTSASSMRALRDGADRAAHPEEINRALSELPSDYRLAVLLSDVEGLSYKEIADVMGCPIGTVMSRLHRGRRCLRSMLEAKISQAVPLPASSNNVNVEAPSEGHTSLFRVA